MLKSMLLGLGAVGLALAGSFGPSQGGPPPEKARVLCCGECRPGDDCLSKCEVIGKVPEGTKLACCRNCREGDDCHARCGARKPCCEVK